MVGQFGDPMRQLAIVCGLMFIPHILAAFVSRQAVLEFFRAAGFRPVGLFVIVSVTIEIFVSLCLVFGIWLPFAASIAGLFMLTAGAAVWRVSKGRWVWNLGGCELHVFWAVCCLLVATHS